MVGKSVPEKTAGDGRRQRSERSRNKIAKAMIDLIMAGDLMPSAEAVADRADVGLRSVFRHFKDMESLFLEVSRILRDEHQGAFTKPVIGDTWQEQIGNSIIHYTALYESLLPMLQATNLHLYRSDVVRDDHRQTNAFLRSTWLDILPKSRHADAVLIEGLDAILSSACWLRLRIDQGLPPDEARLVIEKLVTTVLKSIEKS